MIEKSDITNPCSTLARTDLRVPHNFTYQILLRSFCTYPCVVRFRKCENINFTTKISIAQKSVRKKRCAKKCAQKQVRTKVRKIRAKKIRAQKYMRKKACAKKVCAKNVRKKVCAKKCA